MLSSSEALPHYTTALTRLRQNRSTGPAPHKPILLLALFDLLDEVTTPRNLFPIDARLAELFDRNWALYVTTEHKKQLYQPVHYLQRDGLGWTVYRADGQPDIRKYPHGKTISTKGLYGRFEDSFFQLLAQPEWRDYFRTVVIDWYFHTFPLTTPTLPNRLEEPPAAYAPPVRDAYTRYRRSKQFGPAVLHLYDHTCALSRLRVTPNAGIVQACHITAHAATQNDHYANGIALCANLHRAFDHGLLSISDDYRVLVQSTLQESTSPYGIRRLAGKKILLPADARFLPDRAALAAHRQHWGY